MTYTDARKAWISFSAVLESFVTSKMSLCGGLGGILEG